MVPFIFSLSLLLSWDLLGMGRKKGWVGVSLPPLRMMTGPVQHFYSSILDAKRFSVFAKLLIVMVFWEVSIPIFKGLFTTTYLVPPAGNEIKCC